MSSTQALRAAATGNVQPRAEGFPAMIDQLKKQVALALPKHLNADRMARIALTCFRNNPQLADCNPVSVFASVIQAAQLGLEPGIMGQAYLVPYKGQCTLVPGWQGLVDLAQRSGRASVWTGAVFAGDHFEYAFGTNPFIEHKAGGEDSAEALRYVYAVGAVRGAEIKIIDVWPVEKCLRHRNRFNKVGQRHYSYQHWEMYCRKLPLLQVLKYLPKSVELSKALEAEFAGAAGQPVDLKEAIDGTWVAPATDDNGNPIDTETGEVQGSTFDAAESARLDAEVAARENGK